MRLGMIPDLDSQLAGWSSGLLADSWQFYLRSSWVLLLKPSFD